MKTKLGIVLSGGGAKGAYEAGFLKALSEFNIQPDAISGTSIGALNGAIYSSNKNTKDVALALEKIWKDLANTKALSFIDKKKTFMTFVEVVTLFSPIAPVTRLARVISYLSSKGNNKSGALTTEPINNILGNYTSIEKLRMGLPFYVGLTESSGNVIDALRLFELENNGLTEYRKIKDLKRLGRGFRNFEHFRNRFLYATRSAPILNGMTDYNPVLYLENDDF